jgi:hypothetical protein
MNSENEAWRQLQRQAAEQLRPDFAARVLNTAKGPEAAAWRQLQAEGAAQLRPGFAERVMRAARALPRMPSLFNQFALGAATAGVCLLGVVFFHARATASQEQRNLDKWQQLAAEIQDNEPSP